MSVVLTINSLESVVSAEASGTEQLRLTIMPNVESNTR